MKKIIILYYLIFSINLISAQAPQRCHTNEHEQILESQNPLHKSNRETILNAAREYVNAKSTMKTSTAIKDINVVVHVVYKNATQNISDAQIASQIAVLNQDFARTNADAGNTRSYFTSIVGPSAIRFHLATTDPLGSATSGITRTSTPTSSVFTTADQVKSAATGGKAPWNTANYLNIWVCELEGGVLGYAQFPGGPIGTDGVVIGYTFFGTMGTATAPYDGGRTTTHEVGHYLGLYHIWGDDFGACTGSDDISDTPNAGDANYTACAPDFINTCGSGTGDLPDMYENYMDYVNDDCMNAFTLGQIDMMESILETTRTNIYTGGTTPPISCSPQPLPFIEGFETSAGLPANWTNFNDDAGVTWARNTSVGHTSGNCYAIDNFNTDFTGSSDIIVTPAFNLSSLSSGVLSFWLAYSQYLNTANGITYSDRLKVLYSTDCGATWFIIYDKSGATLQTTTAPSTLSTGFMPTAADWRKETIDIAPLTTITNFAFENVSGYGNLLYIDDINIGNLVNINELDNELFTLTPNPSNGIFHINTLLINSYNFEVYDATGQMVNKGNISFDDTKTLDFGNLCSGSYLVKFDDTNNHQFSKKFVIAH